jgi:hypothetical protein
LIWVYRVSAAGLMLRHRYHPDKNPGVSSSDTYFTSPFYVYSLFLGLFIRMPMPRNGSWLSVKHTRFFQIPSEFRNVLLLLERLGVLIAVIAVQERTTTSTERRRATSSRAMAGSNRPVKCLPSSLAANDSMTGSATFREL